MSHLRQDSLAYKVMVLLHSLPSRQVHVLDLIRSLASEEHLTHSKIGERCRSAITKNYLMIDGKLNWKLTSRGAAVVESMLPDQADAIPLQKAAPRTIHNSCASSKPFSMAGVYKNVRADGLLFLDEPSLMGVTRKLPSGEVVE